MNGNTLEDTTLDESILDSDPECAVATCDVVAAFRFQCKGCKTGLIVCAKHKREIAFSYDIRRILGESIECVHCQLTDSDWRKVAEFIPL